MADADEIARDIVVAWLSRNDFPYRRNEGVVQADQTGELIGKVYKAVLAAVREGQQSLNS